MKLYFTSLVGWLGCSVAAMAVVFSFSTAEVVDTSDGGGDATADAAPKAFAQVESGRANSSLHQKSGRLDGAGDGQPGSNAPGKTGSEISSGDKQSGANQLTSGSDLPVLDFGSFGFKGMEFGNLPVSQPDAAGAPSGEAFSLALTAQPESDFFLLSPIQFPSPELPNGVASGTTNSGTGSTASGGTSYFYVVDSGSGTSGPGTNGSGATGSGATGSGTPNDGLPGDGLSGDGGSGVEAVPEPSSWVLACLAIGTAIYLRRRAPRAQADS